MKTLKYVFLITIMLLGSLAQANNEKRVYGIHLFFNETEFVDVLTITKNKEGVLQGHMYVPNDFEGDVDELSVEKNKISFDLFVPKNSSRPKDLVFHYEGEFFDKSHQQLIGYATLKDSKDFLASFTGFLRE